MPETVPGRVAATIGRHRFATRVVLVEAAMLGLAWAVVAAFESTMASVAFGLLVTFAGAIAVVSLVAGAAMLLTRVRRD